MNPIDLIKRYRATGALIGAIFTILAGCATHDLDTPAHDRASRPTCPDGNIPIDEQQNPARLPLAQLPLGCVNRANLRAMVADPNDLDQGRALEPASGAQEARAIEAYKKGAVKKLSTSSEAASSTMSAQTTAQAQ